MEDVNTVLMPMDANMIQHESTDGSGINKQMGYMQLTLVNCWMQHMPHACDPISYTQL